MIRGMLSVPHVLFDAEGVVLLDTGTPFGAAQIRRALERCGFRASDVRAILLTHGHIDHAGNLAALKAKHFAPARAPIYRYMVWAHKQDGGITPGRTFATPGDSFVVTLGGWTVGGSSDTKVATFVHELGHFLTAKREDYSVVVTSSAASRLPTSRRDLRPMSPSTSTREQHVDARSSVERVAGRLRSEVGRNRRHTERRHARFGVHANSEQRTL